MKTRIKAAAKPKNLAARSGVKRSLKDDYFQKLSDVFSCLAASVCINL
jgi:hypothetical protein